jgi:RNA polymerase sigma factor (sigma-70 family)
VVDEDHEWRSWVQHLVEGDDRVVGEFWGQYGERLRALAAELLNARFYRREGPDDIVQSVCRTFVRRARTGEFELANRDTLWRLLYAITVTKTREKVRFHGRQKRAADRDRSLVSSRDGGPPVVASEPTPAEAAAFADQLQHLLADVDEEERRVVELRLQEYTYPEIAEQLGCSKRTVRRIVKRVQSRWQCLLEQSS